MLPIALDVNGGDKAPSEILAGARAARDDFGLSLLLVGTAEALDGVDGFETLVCTEVIEMDDDAAQGVRRKKDSTLVRAAEAVRDGRASSMVSAGNTGATMASALLRMGRIKGVSRPCIATPIPVLGRAYPNVLVDSGANAECNAEWLVQFALMASVYASTRYGLASPRVGLLSIGEESSKGNPLTKETHELLAAQTGINFVGNVEGRDLMLDEADVIVTDGFTGNVALKTLEGGLKAVITGVLDSFNTSPEAAEAAKVLLPSLLPLYDTLHPDSVGGAMLLGTDGVCIISHGSSSARAVVNACKVASEMVERELVAHIAAVIAAV